MEYCYECDKDVNFHYQTRIYLFQIDEINIEFVDDVAICNICGEEVYIHELHDRIISKAHNMYKEKLKELKRC